MLQMSNFLKKYKWIYILPLVCVFLNGCKTDTTEHAGSRKNTTTKEKKIEVRAIPASTEQMVKELKAIASNTENKDMWYLNAQKAEYYEKKLASMEKDPSNWIQLSYLAANQWLNAGNYDRCLTLLNGLFDYLKTNRVRLKPEQITFLKELQAIAYMRKGEIENCLNDHNAYSCLLPIEGTGQHKQKEGSQEAIKIYEKLLGLDSENMGNRWLYNIAKMTLGQYPHAMNSKYLIPSKVFESEAKIDRFTDVAMGVGVAVNDISGSVIAEDFNGDYYLDLMVSSYGLDHQLHYFENDGKGGFIDKTVQAGLTGLWSGLNMVQADYNNDGYIDVLVLRGAWLNNDGKHPNSLLRNDGNGHFTDVTKEAGLYSLSPTQTASWGDYDNDGFVDLFVGNESVKNANFPSVLYHNNGDGTFTDKSKESGLEINAFIKGCSWGDVNQDGWLDLYVSNITGYNILMLNGGKNGKFKDIAHTTGTQEPLYSFPTWIFDFDQDGKEDIFVSGYDTRKYKVAHSEVAKDYVGIPTTSEKPRLYHNIGNGKFKEVSEQMNVDKVLFTMGCNFGDLNNDGYPDFYAATGSPNFKSLIPNRMFLNDRGTGFKDVTKVGGFGHLQKGHGVAFGDLDADGDQDVYVVLGGAYQGDNFMNALFENPGNSNKSITLKLVGTKCNTAAIGAQVRTIVIDKNGKEKSYYQRVSSGGSFGANTLRLEQGIGSARSIDRLEISWPGNPEIQVVKEIEIGGFYEVIEEKEAAKQIDLQSVKFKRGHQHMHH